MFYITLQCDRFFIVLYYNKNRTYVHRTYVRVSRETLILKNKFKNKIERMFVHELPL